MARLSLNPRKSKTHRSYDVAEVSGLYGVTRDTVRSWCKAGLPAVRVAGALLVYGDDLRAFLEKRRASQRSICPPGSIFCLRCRVPRRPDQALTSIVRHNGSSASVTGPCPQCGARMNRRVSLPKLAAAGFACVTATPAVPHLDHSPKPSVKPYSSGSEEP